MFYFAKCFAYLQCCVYFLYFLASNYKIFAVKSPHHQTAPLHPPKYWGVKDLLHIFKPAIKLTTVIPDCFLFTSCTQYKNLPTLLYMENLHFYSVSHPTAHASVKQTTNNPTLKWQSSPQEAWDTGVTTASRSQIPEQWWSHISSSIPHQVVRQFTSIQGSNSIFLKYQS